MSKHGRKSIPLQKSQTSAALNIKSQMNGLLQQTKDYKETMRKNALHIEDTAQAIIRTMDDDKLLGMQRAALVKDYAQAIIVRAQAAQR